MKIYKLQSKNYKLIRGFTMIEMTAAMALFIIVVIISTTTFARSLKNFRNIASLMGINDNTSLTIEHMTREIRTGKNFVVANPDLTTGIGDELQFNDAKGNKVYYYVENNRLIKKVDEKHYSSGGQQVLGSSSSYEFVTVTFPMTAADIDVKEASFYITAPEEGGIAKPYLITISMAVGSTNSELNKVVNRIQTSISKRSLNVQ